MHSIKVDEESCSMESSESIGHVCEGVHLVRETDVLESRQVEEVEPDVHLIGLQALLRAKESKIKNIN